jgi:hypothetical protein
MNHPTLQVRKFTWTAELSPYRSASRHGVVSREESATVRPAVAEEDRRTRAAAMRVERTYQRAARSCFVQDVVHSEHFRVVTPMAARIRFHADRHLRSLFVWRHVDRHGTDSEVRTRLPAGGGWIRTLGPPPTDLRLSRNPLGCLRGIGRRSGRLGSARFCNNHAVTAGSIGCSALLFSRGP